MNDLIKAAETVMINSPIALNPLKDRTSAIIKDSFHGRTVDSSHQGPLPYLDYSNSEGGFIECFIVPLWNILGGDSERYPLPRSGDTGSWI